MLKGGLLGMLLETSAGGSTVGLIFKVRINKNHRSKTAKSVITSLVSFYHLKWLFSSTIIGIESWLWVSLVGCCLLLSTGGFFGGGGRFFWHLYSFVTRSSGVRGNACVLFAPPVYKDQPAIPTHFFVQRNVVFTIRRHIFPIECTSFCLIFEKSVPLETNSTPTHPFFRGSNYHQFQNQQNWVPLKPFLRGRPLLLPLVVCLSLARLPYPFHSIHCSTFSWSTCCAT